MDGADPIDAAIDCTRQLIDLQGDDWTRRGEDGDPLRAALRPTWDGFGRTVRTAARLRAATAQECGEITREVLPLLADYLESELEAPSMPRLEELARIVAPRAERHDDPTRFAAAILRSAEQGVEPRAAFLWPGGAREERANRTNRVRLALLSDLLR